MTAPFRTLVDVLRLRAATMTDARAYTFLADGEEETATLTWGDLDRRARDLAVALRERGVLPGDRALLLYPPGLEFVAGFFGALYAGVVAVPCYPPHPAQVARTLPRILGIIDDARPVVVMAPVEVARHARHLQALAPSLAALPWLVTDDPNGGDAWTEPRIDGSSLAFLQYTSGSTSQPRGVMVSHANLLHNLAYANHVEENDGDSVSVSWLPVIHDMGLIEGVLEPAFAGYPAVLMAPAAFLQRPVRWLRAIDRYRATNSGGPNFAYDHCTRKITPAQCAGLDLSSWRVAYNGAEPIRPATLRAFHEKFAGCGFRWRSFYPVYGLAEGTLVVSSGRRTCEPVIIPASVAALAEGQVQSPTKAEDSRQLVASGRPGFGTEVCIVDPAQRRPLPDGAVGEIWVASPSVAHGYWNRPEDTARTFGATLDGDPHTRWLRTGDLGALRDGDLFVAGRIKDVLIVHGMKYYPQDIEQAAEVRHPALRPGSSAAFTTTGDDGADRVVLVAEVDLRRLEIAGMRATDIRNVSPLPGAAVTALDLLARSVRDVVLREHGVALHSVALAVAGEVPRTTSGKIRRSACAEAWAAGSLDLLAEQPRRRATWDDDRSLRTGT